MIVLSSIPRSIASRLGRGIASTARRSRWRRCGCLRGGGTSGIRGCAGGRPAARRRVRGAGSDLAGGGIAGRSSGWSAAARGSWSRPSATRGTPSRRSRWRASCAARGHEVAVETWERWREPVEELGLRFQAAEEYEVFPPPPPGEGAGRRPRRRWRSRRCSTSSGPSRWSATSSPWRRRSPPRCAGCRGRRWSPTSTPSTSPGCRSSGWGWRRRGPRLGRRLWRAALPVLEAGLRRGRRELNETRARLGLPPLRAIPRRDAARSWCSSPPTRSSSTRASGRPEVRITGPLGFEIPHPDIELPPGDEPLVLVASSTAQDPECELIRRCFEALAGEPVRVVATTNGHFPRASRSRCRRTARWSAGSPTRS